jgi:peptidoglycan/LPS O-acetylase OafA/YrhL
VELFFYAVFPFLILSFDRYRTRDLFFGIGAFWLASGLLQLYYTVWLHPEAGTIAHEVLIYLPPMNLNGFLCGMFGGICLIRHGRPLTPSKSANIAIAIVCALAPAALTLQFGREVNVGGTAPFLVISMYVLVTQRTRLWDWMMRPFFETLGQMSYAMCILQVPLFILVLNLAKGRIRLTQTELFYSYMVVLMIVSYLLYRFYEAPLREWFRQRLRRADTGAT